MADLMSNDPSVPSTSKLTSPEGLTYTSDLANSPNCLAVFVEDTTTPFTFNRTKGSIGPVKFNSITEVLAFQAANAGVLIVFQDGTADWNFSL